MLQMLRKSSPEDFSERVAREKPEGMVAAEHQLRAARQARSDHAEQLRKACVEYNDLNYSPDYHNVSNINRLLDEIASLEKKSPDFEASVAAARQALEVEREAFAPAFFRMADEAAGEQLKHVVGAIAAIEAVALSLATIERESFAVNRPTKYGPYTANNILHALRALAKALDNA
ncbi:hypothetical protein ACFFP0_00750 [Rhizobium puerariae]|uniref:Uncharacterized protein n=1 Tax=Rhizobium puerariae TaxID=1585791 RepID=A0ABV6ADB8_9HYPH